MNTIKMVRSLGIVMELARELQTEKLSNAVIGPDTVRILLQRIIDETSQVRAAVAEQGGMNIL